jgi:uncharacterized protein with HEPN domain
MDGRLADLVDQIRRSATDAATFIEDMSREESLTDKRTQNAVIMCRFVVGESATKVLDQFPEFAGRHVHTPWRKMRGIRNRIAHGYFDVNLEVVRETAKMALPELLMSLPSESGNGAVRRRL